jgi:acetate kinase
MSNAGFLVLNGGSSSLKFALYDAEDLQIIGRGVLSGIGSHPALKASGEAFSGHIAPAITEDCQSASDAARILLGWLEDCMEGHKPIAIGHRIVHGGDQPGPQRITPALMQELRALIPLAPLHQPYNLQVIDMVAELHPDLPQIGCFDTSFHQTVPAMHRRFAIPRALHDKGVKRYGFHGLNYQHVAGQLQQLDPAAFSGKTLVAHLGSGASLCALDAGQSLDTTMGFSAIDGLVMGTRPGALDPGVLLYLLDEGGLDSKALTRFLYRECGLLGASGISADMADLLASPAPEAAEAIDVFCHRLRREAGALACVLGGLDTLVLTGGIGQYAAPIRTRLAEDLAWLGVKIDPALNLAATGNTACKLSPPDSATTVWLIPADEEGVIAAALNDFIRKVST